MSRRMRAHDWTRTTLGAPESWPQHLRTALSLCLTSRIPIVMYWGEDFNVLYNDAYISFLGTDKHPRFLGAPGCECWSEIWPTIGPMLRGVVATGEATWSQDLLMYFARRVPAEEVYVRFSFGPIVSPDGSRIDGIFCPCTETTERVIGERRIDLLRRLGQRQTGAREATEVALGAIEALAGNPNDIPLAAVYLRAPQATVARQIGSVGIDEQATRRLPDELPMPTDAGMPSELGLPLDALVSSRPVRQLLSVPIPGASRDEPMGFLLCGLSANLVLDDDYRSFLDLVASSIGGALVEAEAYEAERRRAEALAEIDRAKTTFFTNVSHELRTPLTLMLGPLEEALPGLHGRPEQAMVATAQRNAERLLKLVNTLLEFARVEGGRATALFQPTDVSTLTAELSSSFRSACEKAGLVLDVDCPPFTDVLYIDRDHWERIVLNLVSNAFKFTLEGSITVTMQPSGDGTSAELVVRDTGSGIPAGELHKLFGRFERIEGVRGRSFEGSGIGLALTSELVKLHGGSISAESVEGRGTTFTVRIPFGKAHLPAEKVRDAREPARHPSQAAVYVGEALQWLPLTQDNPAEDNKFDDFQFRSAGHALHAETAPRILIADDNADLRAYLQRLLSTRYAVTTAVDGIDALEKAFTAPPDLVLCDVMMPRLDGFGLLARLRADERTLTLPILLLSARAGEEARVEGLAAGADDYLVKPFSARELMARVGAHLATARLRRNAVQSLRDADRRKDEFLATLAHELRNPLAPIRNALHLFKVSGDGAPAPALREMVERQVNHMVRLVDDLMEASRISRGKLELQRAPVDLGNVLRTAFEASKPLLDLHRHLVTFDTSKTPLVVDGDAVRLTQVFANLLNNAAKYTDDGGAVKVTSRREDDWAVVEVRDNGIGLSLDQIPRLFEMFAQMEAVGTRAAGGLGIGLALARRLVQMHGGGVTVHSDGLGHGSTFSVRLPLVHAASEPHIASQQSRQNPLEAQRILVVDDNHDAAESLGMLLDLLGAEVRVEHDGPSALAAAAEWMPTVVLLDLGMPQMDGYEVAGRLRREPSLKNIMLIALTGWGQEEDRERTKSAGFDHHLVKPVDVDVLETLLVSMQTGEESTAEAPEGP